jgi:hypothetical protein
MSLDCCPSPLTETISLFQGQLKWEVIYLPHGQVQILEFECVKNLHIFTRPILTKPHFYNFGLYPVYSTLIKTQFETFCASRH